MKKEPANTLDFAVIQTDLDTLLKGMELKLEREFPDGVATTGAREVLWLTFRVALNTYRTIRYICGDTPADPDRKLEYSVSCPPMVRTLADALFTVVFLLEDLEERAKWYYKSGWREQQEMFLRHRDTYGDTPEWRDWLSKVEEKQREGKQMFGVKETEAADLSLIPYWPIPSQMIRYGGFRRDADLPPERKFLEYLNDWIYRELSQESHLSYPGLVTRGSLLLKVDKREANADLFLINFKSTVVFVTVTMLLAVCSELEFYFKFGFKDRLVILWWILKAPSPIPKEVFERRYQSLLM